MLAWRHVRALRDPEAWDPWLHRLTVRACYRLARTHRRRDLVELHVVPDLEPAVDIDISLAARRTRPARSRDRQAAPRPASRDGARTSISTCPSRRRPRSSTSPSGRRSPGFIAAWRRSGRPSPTSPPSRRASSGSVRHERSRPARTLHRRVDGRRRPRRAGRRRARPDPLHDGPDAAGTALARPAQGAPDEPRQTGHGGVADSATRPRRNHRAHRPRCRGGRRRPGHAAAARRRLAEHPRFFCADRGRGQRAGRPSVGTLDVPRRRSRQHEHRDRRRPRSRVERRRHSPCPGARRRLGAMDVRRRDLDDRTDRRRRPGLPHGRPRQRGRPPARDRVAPVVECGRTHERHDRRGRRRPGLHRHRRRARRRARCSNG